MGVRMWQFGRVIALATLAALMMGAQIRGPEPSGPAVKEEHFDRDPGWEGYNNHLAPEVIKTVHQDFGYSETNYAGQEKGEIGGTIWRSSTPASYADNIPPKTLNDKLEASGTFAVTATDGSSGVFFGWFNADDRQPGRQNTLGLRFAGAGRGARLALQLVTASNEACGTKITPWIVDKTKPKGEGRKYRPPSIKNDGTRYTWKLSYDPNANGGDGQIEFTIRGNSKTPAPFEGKTFTVALPKGYKQQGATFNRFGLMNAQKPGNAMSIYFDDLTYDGMQHSFDTDPGFVGVGNRDTYKPRQEGGIHDFGFSAKTHFAGGSPGEIGGIVWRSGRYAYYADRVGPLSLNDRLEAEGNIMLAVGMPDSGVYLGWFNGAEKENSPPQAGSFLAVRIGGPTHIGHYFVPAYATTRPALVDRGDRRHHAPNISVESRRGPVLVPRQVFHWKIVYDPAANGGNGEIQATLGNESVTLPLKPGDKAKGATFDRFGLFSTHRGGNYLEIYLDDLRYTAR